MDSRVLHDGAPPRFGTWVCDCARCAESIRALRLAGARLHLVIKRSEGRDRVSLAAYVGQDCDASRWCTSDTDYVREVFFAQERSHHD